MSLPVSVTGIRWVRSISFQILQSDIATSIFAFPCTNVTFMTFCNKRNQTRTSCTVRMHRMINVESFARSLLDRYSKWSATIAMW